MSVRAYVLLRVEAGKLNSVVDSLSQLPEVKDAYPITGDYDIVADIEVEKVADIHELMSTKIHKIDGVKETNTHIAFQ